MTASEPTPAAPLDGIVRDPGDLDAQDIESLRLVLAGESVVNWAQLATRSAESARRILRVNGFDPASPNDAGRTRALYAAAARYIEDNFGYSFPDPLRAPAQPEQVLVAASTRNEHQKLACMLLKVAHVLNHLEGYELRHILPASDQALFALAERRLRRALDAIRDAGVGLASWESSRKTRDSIITKLLSKSRSFAGDIFDKLRFRIITGRRVDIPYVLASLLRLAIPFNNVIPGESKNNLFPFATWLESHPHLRRLARKMQFPPEEPAVAAEEVAEPNPFSAPEYRVVHFVADIPVRVDSLLRLMPVPPERDLGRLVFVLCEFQLMDLDTWEHNESGPASHDAYKARQKHSVLRRLVWGSPAPSNNSRSSGGGR